MVYAELFTKGMYTKDLFNVVEKFGASGMLDTSGSAILGIESLAEEFTSFVEFDDDDDYVCEVHLTWGEPKDRYYVVSGLLSSNYPFTEDEIDVLDVEFRKFT